MFKHILVPTDGSKLSAKAVKTAARLAKATGARLTGLYVVAPYASPVYAESMIAIPAVTTAEYQAIVRRHADRALSAVKRQAGLLGVPCATLSPVGGEPWSAILRAARAKKCDAIVMASHGRGRLASLLLGSETTKVLAHSKIPVLVCR